MKNITQRQSEVLDFIKYFLERHQYPPTVREVAAHFGISIKGAYDHIKALEKKNAISCDSHRSRSICLAEEAPDESCELVRVPILGHVAAGLPLMAKENLDGYLSLPRALVGRGEVFALKVEGDSMINAGILDGDTAIFLRQPQVENGQIVVAMVDEAVTLKRFYREKNRVRLQAENPAYSPIFTADAQILGRLSAVIRSY